MSRVGQSEGTIRSFSTKRTAFTPIERSRRVVTDNKVYTLYGKQVTPNSKTIELNSITKNANIPVLQQKPKDDMYLQYGRGVVRAQLEQASKEERIRNLGEVPSTTKMNKISNLDDFERRDTMNSMFTGSTLSRTNTSPPISPMDISSPNWMDPKRKRTAGEESVVNENKRRRVAGDLLGLATALQTAENVRRFESSLQNIQSSRDPLSGNPLKRKNTAKGGSNKKFIKDTTIAGEKRDRVIELRRVGPAKKKFKEDRTIIGEKRKRGEEINKAGPKKKKVKIGDEYKRKAPDQMQNPKVKKQKTSDEKVTRLGNGMTLRRLKPKNYR